MTANDTATRRFTTGIVLAVGLFACSDPYSHIYALARDHGQGIVSAALLPLAGDGLIAAASSGTARRSAQRGGPAVTANGAVSWTEYVAILAALYACPTRPTGP
jgi:hypothetical protein